MLEIAMRLPPGALIGGEDRLLSEMVLRSGGARFIAREKDLVRTGEAITGWRESRMAVEAVAAGPNTGNSRFEPGPPGALLCRDGMNCGFTLPGFAPEVEAFTMAVVYTSDGEAKTLASVFTGQAHNMIFLTEGEGRLLAKDKMNSVSLSLPVPKGRGVKLALMSFDGRSLRLGMGEEEAKASANVPGLAHRADFFIGCRSNRSGLAKMLGQSLLHEVIFWPDRCLQGSVDPGDRATLSALRRYLRWTF